MIVLSFVGHVPPPDPRITHFNIYRKQGTNPFVRIAQITPQTEYLDATGTTGDTYYFTYFDNVRFIESGPSPLIVASDSLDSVTISGFAAGIDLKPAGAIPPGGRAWRQELDAVEVTIHLKGISLAMPVSDGQFLTSLKQTVLTDDAGRFWFEVAANDRIFPSNTFYMVEYLDRRFFKYVRRARGDGQLLALLEDVQPLELR